MELRRSGNQGEGDRYARSWGKTLQLHEEREEGGSEGCKAHGSEGKEQETEEQDEGLLMGTAWAILGVLMVLGLIYRTVRKDAQARFQSKIADNTLKHLKELNEVDNESDKKLKDDVTRMRSNPMAWWLRRNRNGS